MKKRTHAVSRLTDQYRMNEDITTLANELVYHGALRCGSTKVSLRKLAIPVQILNDAIRLPLPVLEGTTTGTTQQHWMKEVLNAQRSVVFINTDSLELGPLESRGHKNGTKQEQTKKQRSKRKTVMVNEMEVSLIKLICRVLIRCGISQKDVGVISPYRSQLKLLSHSLQISQIGACVTQLFGASFFVTPGKSAP